MKRVVFKSTLIGLVAMSLLFVTPALADSGISRITLNIDSAITLSLSSDLLSIDNLAPGTLGNSNNITANVITNNFTGYTLYITAGNSDNASTSLIHENVAVASKFSSLPLGTTFTTSTFTDNSWGYSTDSGNTFKGFSLYTDEENAIVLNDSEAPIDEDTNFMVAAKAAPGIENGTYSNVITFTAVTNYVPEMRTLADITYMQEVTNDICGNTPTPLASDGASTPQYQLIDNRDNKTYFVAKLADGKCWMTQNLDLNLSSSVALTDEKTDLNSVSSWTPTRSTIDVTANMTTTGTSATITGWANDYNTPYSIDPGNVYFDGTYFTSLGCNYLTTNCEHFENTKQTLNSEHGHVGNYYNWSAVVASNNTASFTTSGAGYPDSICPKGWRLPYGRGTTDDDFAILKSVYGNPSSDQTLLNVPLFFVRAGSVLSGSLVYTASSGHYWLSAVHSSDSALYLSFSPVSVYPATVSNRYLGNSVRCVAGESKTYSINYDKNTTDTVSNMPENITSKTHSNSVPISSNTPTRSGYQFAGWATTSGGTATYQPGTLVDVSSGSVTLYAVWQELHTFTLTYNANGGSGAPSTQTETTTNTSATFTISSTIPTKDNYDFIGWSTTSTATTPTYTYNSGSFSPSTITISTPTTLYAIWQKIPITCNPSATSISNAVCMQDINMSVVTSMVSEQQYQLYDSRDEKQYYVSKLADGKVWMTQNLDLDLSTNKTLTSDDTDLNSVSSWTPSNSTETYVYMPPNQPMTPYSYDSGDKYYYTSGSMVNDTEYSSLSACVAAGHTEASCTHYHVGNHYNWNAAVASNNSSNLKTEEQSAPDSICPKGWRLPTSYNADTGPLGDFSQLIAAYNIPNSESGSQTIRNAPFYMVRAASTSGTTTLGTAGQRGGYWSSVVKYYSSSLAYSHNLILATNTDYYVRPTSHENRYVGYSVRCVSRDAETPAQTLADITEMQEMTPEVCAATPTPQASAGANTPQYQLTDNRDGKKYWVAKLADGNCWMTQNLDLNLSTSKALTNQDTDLNTVDSWTPTYTTVNRTSNKTTTGTYNSDDTWPGDRYSASLDVGDVYFDGEYVEYASEGSDACNYLTTDCEHFSNSAFSNGTHGHIGNYYSWLAATASGDRWSVSELDENDDSKNSICPKGWRLPKWYTGTYDYENLLYEYGSDMDSDELLLNTPFFYTRAGMMQPSMSMPLNKGTLGYAGTLGYYWLGTQNNSSSGATFNLSDGMIWSGGFTLDYGMAVRCIARSDSLLGAANKYADPLGETNSAKDYTGTMLISMLLWPIAALSAGGVAVIIYKRGTGE